MDTETECDSSSETAYMEPNADTERIVEQGKAATGDEVRTKTTSEYLPIDKGWAWIILIAATMEMVIVIGWFRCFGIFFVELQRRFNSTASGISLIYSLLNVGYSLTAFLVMTVGESISSRVSAITGANMLTIGFLLTGFTESLTTMYIIGLWTGTGFALVEPQVLIMLNTYFYKYRGIANNIATGGMSAGALVMAPMYTKLFEFYGFTGTYIITAGIMLNLAVVGIVLRPMTFYCKQSNKQANIPLTNVDPDNDNKMDNEFRITENLVNSEFHYSNDRAPSDIMCSYATLNAGENGTTNTVRKTERGSSRSLKCVEIIKTLPAKFGVHGILRKRVFQYYLVCNVFLCCGCVLTDAYIAPHAVDSGANNDQVALVVITFAIADLCSKGVFGYLSDRKWINRSTIMALAAGALGLCSFLLFFINTIPTIVALVTIIGILQPVYMALFPVVAVDILSLEQLKGALGCIALVQGASVAAVLPLAGYLRDVTGNYYATFCLAGTLLCVGGLMGFFLPTVKKRSERADTCTCKTTSS